jgi:hypothetical protein
MKAIPLFCALAALVCLSCSENAPDPGQQSATAGSDSAAGNGSSAGQSSSSAGGSGPGNAGAPAASGGASGSAGAVPSTGGAAGSTPGGSGGGTGEPMETPTNFACTQVIGAMITGEWFNGGNFEQKLEAAGGDPDKWEIKNEHYGTIEKWADPSEGPAANDLLYWGHAVGSACTTNSNNPDRVIFTAISWELTTEDQWKTALEAVVTNIKAKYSNVRFIELVSHMRCPNNMMCNPNAVQGPGSDAQASLQDCYVWPAQDAAMAAVAEADPIVGLAPKFEADTCRPEGIDGAHLGSANGGVAQKVADHYADNP